MIKLSNFVKIRQHPKSRFIIFTMGFAFIGTALIIRTFAANPPNTKITEGEVYSNATNVSQVADSSASGSSYVQFESIDNGSTTCDLSATTSNFNSQITAAAPGQTICLANGNYGTFSGTNKAIIIKAASNAAPVMNIDFGNGDTGFTLDGMTGMSGDIVGSASNITIKNSTFDSAIHIGTTTNNANIVLDGNRHVNITPQSNGVAGRIHLDATGVPCGITVRNSIIGGGYSDGIRADCNGILIENNKFIDLQDAEPYHADPIQIYGGKNITIRGNLFDNRGLTGLPNESVAAYVMITGGTSSLTIEDNVFRSPGYTYMIDGSISGGTIQYNTAETGTCGYGQPCGQIAATGTFTARNNILGRVPGGTATYNMVYGGSVSSTNFVGTPTFIGGSGRSTYADFYLAPGSPGKNAGSEGIDVGIRAQN